MAKRKPFDFDAALKRLADLIPSGHLALASGPEMFLAAIEANLAAAQEGKPLAWSREKPMGKGIFCRRIIATKSGRELNRDAFYFDGQIELRQPLSDEARYEWAGPIQVAEPASQGSETPQEGGDRG